MYLMRQVEKSVFPSRGCKHIIKWQQYYQCCSKDIYARRWEIAEEDAFDSSWCQQVGFTEEVTLSVRGGQVFYTEGTVLIEVKWELQYIRPLDGAVLHLHRWSMEMLWWHGETWGWAGRVPVRKGLEPVLKNLDSVYRKGKDSISQYAL